MIWIAWAREVLEQLRREPPSAVSLPVQMLEDIDCYLDQWEHWPPTSSDTFRWHADVDPDELEYVAHAFYALDVRLSTNSGCAPIVAAPAEGRDFYLVLVRALLFALASESRARAVFVDQLRSSWSSSAEAE